MDALALYLSSQRAKGYPLQNLERYQKELQAQRELERQRLAIAEDRLKSCMLFVMRTAYWQMYLYDLQTHDSAFFEHYAPDHNKELINEVWQRWKP
jgi:hypothetical protein